MTSTYPSYQDLGARDRELGRLRRERDDVTAALVEAQDRMAALTELLMIPDDDLGEAQLLEEMLTEAASLTDADVVRIDRDGVTHRVVRRMRAATGTGDEVTVPLPAPASGTLSVARDAGPPFSTGDHLMIGTVAAAAAKLVRLADVHRDAVRRATVEREHRVATELAAAVLPTGVPTVAGLDVHARCLQAGAAGGDVLALAERDGALWFAVGDVVGKGLPAAMTMNRAVSALSVAFRTCPDGDPAAVLRAVAASLDEYLEATDLFVTVTVGWVRPGEGMRLCNAGHSPVAHRAPGGGGPAGLLAVVPPGSPPLGVFDGRTYTVELDFGPDAVLLVGSDGLAEQEGPGGDQFGYDRVLARCAGRGRGAADVGTDLMDGVLSHADGLPPSDDRTVLVVRGTG